MAKGHPTLADVARLAGVSEITVSRVVRNKSAISPRTRASVAEAIAKLGYVPNRAAGSLASSGSTLVGVLLPSLSNVVFAEVLRGVADGLKDTDHQPLVGVTDYDPAREEALLASLLAWTPAAIVTTGFEHTPAAMRMLADSRVRVAELMDIDSRPIDVAVGLSHRRAGYETGRHLVARGYRRFGYVGHDWDADVRARSRYDGLREALGDAGVPLVAEARADGPSSVRAGRDTLAALLAGNGEPDVVVFSNDDMAVGGYFHCVAAGIPARTGLGLFGFNGLDVGEAMPVRLSTVRSNRFLIGRLAVQHLLAEPRRPEARRVVDTGFEIVAGETA